MFICYFILLLTMQLASNPSSPNKMPADSFSSLNNPLVSASLILFSLLAVLLIIYYLIIRPMRQRFQDEKKEIKEYDTRLMAAFAELDPEPVFRFDGTGIILMTNEAGFNLSNNGSLVGKELSSIIPEIVKFDLVKCIQDGEQFDFISYIKNKCFRFTMKGIPDLRIGQIYGSNITELKETEEKLSFALETAEKSEKIKSFFLAQISHEIRSPLTAIMGYNSLIKDDVSDKLNKDLEYAFDAIDSSSRRLKRTIDLILNMSLLQSGKYEIHFELIDVASIIMDIVAEYNLEIKQRKIALNFTNITNDAFTMADRYSLIQIFSNIIDNAIKYTAKGSVDIIVGRDQLKRLFVKVTDTGIGMSEEYIKNLFVPFTQEKMGYSRPYEGSGLGMALIKKFSELNKAEIKLQSEKKKGTTLQIIFSL